VKQSIQLFRKLKIFEQEINLSMGPLLIPLWLGLLMIILAIFAFLVIKSYNRINMFLKVLIIVLEIVCFGCLYFLRHLESLDNLGNLYRALLKLQGKEGGRRTRKEYFMIANSFVSLRLYCGNVYLKPANSMTWIDTMISLTISMLILNSVFE